MTTGDEWLTSVAQRMKGEFEQGMKPGAEELTVRELLGKYNFAVRKGYITTHVPNKLEELGLRCVPDFLNVWAGATIRLELDADGDDGISDVDRIDPTHRIDALEAAHNRPISVKPTDPINVATTIMQMHDFSQLPVMQSDFTVDGIVSWKTIGMRTALGKEIREVRHCMDPPVEVNSDARLFDAIGDIREHGYVLVRDVRNRITGIVTTSDLADQFVQLARPFLLIGEIEGHLRNMLHRKFTLEELRGNGASGDDGRPINGTADLTFGGYCHVLQNPDYWERVGLNIDRGEFIKHLEIVREIRNSIMHFNTDGIADSDITTLRDVARFFEELARIQAI